MNTPFVSVIVPTYNEARHIGALMDNLQRQDYQKDRFEVIIADGRSTDDTRSQIEARVASFPNLRWVDNPGKFVPHGLNIALRESKGEIIIRMDAHSVYPENYISRLSSALQALEADNVGGMWITEPGAETAEAKAIALATSHPLGIGNASYRLGADGPVKVDTVPYGCFKRTLFDRIGNFDTDMLRNQDDEFNGRIVRNGGNIYLLPDVKIRYSARTTLPKMRTMFYQYGLYKPLVNMKLGAPATLRQFAPPAIVLLLIGTLIGYFIHPLLAITGAFFLAIYGILIVQTSLQVVSTHATSGRQRMPIVVRTIFMALALAVLLFVPKPIAWPVCGILLVLPTTIDILRLPALWKNVFVHTLLCFPSIHFSYGIGYIFGWIEFGLMKKHQSSKAADLKENR
jgi:glycosyltransferase involved in cell wall biosynthesis